MTGKRKTIIVLLAVAVLLIVARLSMPYLVEDFVNDKLASLEAYDGHVGDIDIHLWRGAYSIEGIEIFKTGASRPVPFFRAERLDLSVEWSSLFRGSIVSEAAFLGPELNLVQGKGEKDSQLGKEENWNARLEELFPFRFNTIGITDGTVRFLAPGIKTQDAITARHLDGEISNLTNVLETGKETFADFRVTAEVLDGAPAVVAGSVNAFASKPTFDVNLEVKKVQLPQVNPWLREFIKADAEAGKFELYLELAAADGKFEGYAKPIMQDVDIYRSGEEEQSALKRVWEGFLDFAANALENKDADQVAARIPFTGTIEDPESNLFATISSVLRNAFISAFARSLEGSITLRDVKENLSGIDPNKEEKAEKQEEKTEKKDESAKPPTGPPGKGRAGDLTPRPESITDAWRRVFPVALPASCRACPGGIRHCSCCPLRGNRFFPCGLPASLPGSPRGLPGGLSTARSPAKDPTTTALRCQRARRPISSEVQTSSSS